MRSFSLLLLATTASAETVTLTSSQPVKLSVEALRAESPVVLMMELEREGPRVRSITLTFDVAQLSGTDAEILKRFVFLDQAMTFTSKQVQLRPLADSPPPKGLLGSPQVVSAFSLSARGKFRLAGKERVITAEGALTFSEGSPLSPASIHVRLSFPALRRSDFGLSTELPRPKVALISISTLLLHAPDQP